MSSLKQKKRGLQIAVDGRVLGHRGVGRYLANVLQAAARLKHTHRFVIYCGPQSKAELAPQDPRFEVRRLAGHPAVVEQWALPQVALADGADLLYYPDNSAAVFPGLPMVQVLHDTMWRRPLGEAIARPSLKQRLQDAYRKVVCPLAARAATRVITISKHSAACLKKDLGLQPPKLSIIAEAADPGLRRRLGPAEAARVRRGLGLRGSYVLASGAADKRKNVDRLIQAFALARQEDRRLAKSSLVITSLRPGETSTTNYEQTAKAAGLKGCIRFVGYVDDRQMKALYQGALCLAFPSLWEGFGLPVLEAFALGCPVLLSNQGALPEVGGPAAVYADPSSVEALCQGLRQAAFGPGRSARIAAGLRRERAYTWDASAKAHLKIFEAAAGAGA